ncbi:hypothetical protein FB45DRAFT_135045 [Roridomyces roridus]|uniref:DUF6533 domain-containing protein n=1 Tax=Roridomyces roridus TaxID=1738132 RepID=A0AAD7BHG1_9AGAR|nr:hypothetical protein FB45DRAFT_135045 [Roridomyces roridus]
MSLLPGSDYGELLLSLVDLRTTRYTSAAGLVILLYDHVLTLPDEARFIWSANWSSGKILFLALRYLVPMIMIIETIQLAGISAIELSDRVCQAWLTLSVLLGWFAIAINNWLVLLRLWVLWERNRAFMISSLLCFAIVQTATLVLAWIDVARMIPTLYFAQAVNMCGFTAPAKLGVVWIPAVVYEFMMILGIAWKIVTRPQTLQLLRDDGYMFFLCLFGVGLTNAIVFLTARPSLLFVALFFTWCFTTTATCRMIISLRRSAARTDAEETDDDSAVRQDPRQVVELAHIPFHASQLSQSESTDYIRR